MAQAPTKTTTIETRTNPTISNPPMVLPLASVLDVPVVSCVSSVSVDANKKKKTTITISYH